MRLFLAVTLPEALQEAIVHATRAAREAAPGVRWVSPPRLHLTMKFLGERPDGEEGRLAAAARGALAPVRAFEASLRGVGAFPNFRRPRVVWLGMHPAEPFVSIAHRLDAALVPLGIAAEARPFRAHVTLGRVADALARPAIEGMERALHAVRTAWPLTVRDVALIQSTLGRGGPTYRVLDRIPLDQSGVS